MTDYTSPELVAVRAKLGIKNIHETPVVKKVTVSCGVGKQRDDKQFLESVRRDLAVITGQAPQERRARMAIAGFNVRENNIVGYKITLRGKRADDFVRRFVRTTLPRVRDFRGVPLTSIDAAGNLSVGITEQLAFPEIHPEKTDVTFGVEATFTTTAKNREEAEVLFRELGFPLTQAVVAADQLGVDIRQGKKEVKS